ncbi:hypothetical protein NRIC_22790 [Enterococcus florum]|uniref:Uncharacterized protein n=1 Tax=Enterococcus florum TaxID=2480627 RepID=A0A4P5PE51_9ENTE|nr:hypothetical protein [Enterococcus florum]GCF94388.1 hypothetical protein NRIC_22790 [Enterococcus florum]
MYKELFQEMNITVIELPVEIVENRPIYSAFLRELPFIAEEAATKKELYRRLMENYQSYVALQPEEEKQTSLQLTPKQLMKYYDGETFDGFSLFDQLTN